MLLLYDMGRQNELRCVFSCLEAKLFALRIEMNCSLCAHNTIGSDILYHVVYIYVRPVQQGTLRRVRLFCFSIQHRTVADSEL